MEPLVFLVHLVPDLSETNITASLSFPHNKSPLYESESLNILSGTSSILHFIPLDMVDQLFVRLKCNLLKFFHTNKKNRSANFILEQPPVFFLPHQNLAKSHHLSSGAKDSKPLKYKNTDIREQNIYNYD